MKYLEEAAAMQGSARAAFTGGRMGANVGIVGIRLGAPVVEHAASGTRTTRGAIRLIRIGKRIVLSEKFSSHEGIWAGNYSVFTICLVAQLPQWYFIATSAGKLSGRD
jgi:hypothetical protein